MKYKIGDVIMPKFKVGDITVIEQRYSGTKDFYIIDGIFDNKYKHTHLKTKFSGSTPFESFENAGWGGLEARLINDEEKLELL